MAEGRILVPWESRVRSNLTMQSNLGEYTQRYAALEDSLAVIRWIRGCSAVLQEYHIAERAEML